MVVDSGGCGGGSTTALLAAEVPKIVKAAARQLKEKSTKTRIAAFHCLRQVQALIGRTHPTNDTFLFVCIPLMTSLL